MLAALFAPAVISAIFSAGASALKDYQQGKITLVQLQTKIAIVVKQEATKVEQANMDALKSTYGSFTTAMISSKLIRWVWAIVTLSQLCVLTFHEVGIPLIVHLTGHAYPSSGDLIKWAYALLAFCLGGGPIIMKTSATK